MAIAFVITLTEARERAPGMMRKLPQFINRLFAILMKILKMKLFSIVLKLSMRMQGNK